MEIPGRLVTQVSRFDQWKDPLGVIDAYRLVREEIADLQLALVGSMALDDPEGWEVYRAGLRGRQPRSADPRLHQPHRRRQRRGQRLPAPLGGRRAEVDPRGLRARRLRVAVEGHAGRRRARRRHPAADARRRRRACSSASTEECATAMLKLLDDRELREQLGQQRTRARARALPAAPPADGGAAACSQRSTPRAAAAP